MKLVITRLVLTVSLSALVGWIALLRAGMNWGSLSADPRAGSVLAIGVVIGGGIGLGVVLVEAILWRRKSPPPDFVED